MDKCDQIWPPQEPSQLADLTFMQMSSLPSFEVLEVLKDQGDPKNADAVLQEMQPFSKHKEPQYSGHISSLSSNTI